MLELTLGISVLGLVYAFLLARFVLQEGTGTDNMRIVSDAIREGAEAFLRRQYKTIGLLSIVVAALLYCLYALAKGDLNQCQHPDGKRGAHEYGSCAEDFVSRGSSQWCHDCRPVTPRDRTLVSPLWWPDHTGEGPVPYCWLRLWGEFRCLVRPAWWRDLHQGCRRWCRPCWEGRGRHPRGRPAEPSCHRRPSR